jgi:cytochrome c oxidase subunit 3
MPMAEKAERLRFADWGGGVSPFAVGSKKLGMWLFIVSDSLTFSGLLIGYSYVRIASERWPMPFEFWPTIVMATVMTFCLLSSSLTMALAVRASSLGDRARVVRFIALTMLGGILFVLLHAKEWAGLIAEGVRMWENPWGVPLFGASFFTLTGLHMLHVISGVIYLGVIALGVSRGRFTHEDVEISGLYWHFVDLVWMFIFPLVYLLSVKMP